MVSREGGRAIRERQRRVDMTDPRGRWTLDRDCCVDMENTYLTYSLLTSSLAACSV